MLTDGHLAAWEALASAATPGPWAWKRPYESADYHELVNPAGAVVTQDGAAGGEYSPDIDVSGPDAAFIAMSRDVVPALIAAVRERDAENARLREKMAAWADAMRDTAREIAQHFPAAAMAMMLFAGSESFTQEEEG